VLEGQELKLVQLSRLFKAHERGEKKKFSYYYYYIGYASYGELYQKFFSKMKLQIQEKEKWFTLFT
jgi:hypothetical protein